MIYLNMKLIIVGLLVAFVACNPTMYKKNEHDLYEPDLVAVSSTVFPELEMPNKDEITSQMDQQFKKAFFSLFKKKFDDTKLEKPKPEKDTLLTNKKKFVKSSEKEKFKSV